MAPYLALLAEHKVDVTTQFDIGDIQRLLSGQVVEPICTPYVYPGYRFEITAKRGTIHLKLCCQPGNVRPPISALLTCQSLSQSNPKQYFTANKSTLCCQSSRQFGSVITSATWDDSATLRRENAATFRVRITYRPEERFNTDDNLKMGLDLVHRYMTQEICSRDVRYITYRELDGNNKLSSPRVLHSTTALLKEHGIATKERMLLTLRACYMEYLYLIKLLSGRTWPSYLSRGREFCFKPSL